jgi:Arc/MetJ-type ribon-helix-helix transcriptional regulator
MGQTNRLNITLTDEVVIKFVRSKVASGAYASESDLVNQGLMALKEESEEQERWEREVVVPAYNRLMADPSSAIPIEEVERHLEERRRQRRQLKAS